MAHKSKVLLTLVLLLVTPLWLAYLITGGILVSRAVQSRTEPKSFPEHFFEAKTYDDIEVTGNYVWFDDTRGIVARRPDGIWRPGGDKSSRGNYLMIRHWIHQIGTYGGTSYRTVLIQLPEELNPEDRFDIHMVSSSRPDTFIFDGEICSTMKDGEATFGNPSSKLLSDADYDLLGSLEIVEIQEDSMIVNPDMIDEATMRDFPPYGVPNKSHSTSALNRSSCTAAPPTEIVIERPDPLPELNGGPAFPFARTLKTISLPKQPLRGRPK